MYEDIFNVNDPNEHPHKLVIRYNDRAQTKFDNANKVRFEDIIRTLSNGNWPCFLSKRAEDEFEYFKKEKNGSFSAKRGPLRSQMSRIEKALGIIMEIRQDGVDITRPEHSI